MNSISTRTHGHVDRNHTVHGGMLTGWRCAAIALLLLCCTGCEKIAFRPYFIVIAKTVNIGQTNTNSYQGAAAQQPTTPDEAGAAASVVPPWKPLE